MPVAKFLSDSLRNQMWSHVPGTSAGASSPTHFRSRMNHVGTIRPKGTMSCAKLHLSSSQLEPGQDEHTAAKEGWSV